VKVGSYVKNCGMTHMHVELCLEHYMHMSYVKRNILDCVTQ